METRWREGGREKNRKRDEVVRRCRQGGRGIERLQEYGLVVEWIEKMECR